MVPAGGWHKFLEKAQEIRSTDQVGTLTRMSLVGRTGIANESQYPQLVNPSLLNKITPAVAGIEQTRQAVVSNIPTTVLL